jgi:tRNA A37 threonylcarbamoyltransferase TsaD
MALLRITGLPAAPLDAAAVFHGEWVVQVRASLIESTDESLTLAFPLADHSHRGWRLAAVQELAREHAPRRINAVACADEPGLSAALALLEPCQGITGQLLALDGTGVV